MFFYFLEHMLQRSQPYGNTLRRDGVSLSEGNEAAKRQERGQEVVASNTHYFIWLCTTAPSLTLNQHRPLYQLYSPTFYEPYFFTRSI